MYPNGLPNLAAHHQVRVVAANHLYDVTQALCRQCIAHGVLFSIENPAQSFMWLTTAMKKFLSDYNLHSTYLHHCMYGSSRRKHTRLVHNIDALCDIGLLCDDSHDHEPWEVTSQGWATAEETAYPWPLCRRMAALVALQILTVELPVKLHYVSNKPLSWMLCAGTPATSSPQKAFLG